MKKIILATLIGLFAASTSFATSMYVKGALGYSLAGEYDVETDVTKIVEDLESSPFFVGAFGLNITPKVDTEFEISYRGNDVESPTFGDWSVSVLNLAVNGIYNVSVDWLPVRPYFGGGLTLGYYFYDDADYGYEESAFGMGLQFFGGASFMIKDNLYIGADLRYLVSLMDPELRTRYGNVEVTHSHFGLLANVKFLF